jgi:virginiamycin B lyase
MRLNLLFASLAAILLCPVLPANAQQRDFPDGPGKDVFVAACGGCHDINRSRAGYTPEGWRTVVQMMKNVAAPVLADQWDTLT